MKVLTVVSLWALLSAIVNPVARCELQAKLCRCLASDDCWPTAQTWDAFNATVGGRLIAPKPTGYPCHDPHHNGAMCESVEANASEPHWRASNAGSLQWDNWEEEGRQQCAWEAAESSRCRQGRVSVLGVQVEDVADVQNAVRFAAKHNLRLVVKSTGHDYLGRSAAAGSFLLWLHKLKKITITTSFTTSSGRAVPAVTVAGGVMWDEVYDALKDTGYVVVGGICLTVCASGGYFQGGGHSVFGPLHGLAVDNVLQIEVVTADGELHVANARQNPELFFALRGGGGGTFGVVTSVTFQLHRAPANLVGPTILLSPPTGTSSWSPATQEEILTVWSQHTGALDGAVWGGYWIFAEMAFNAFFLVPGTQATANETLAPVVEALSRIPHVTVTASVTDWKQDWLSALNYLSTQTGVRTTGGRALVGSRIIPYSALEHPSFLAKAVVSAMATSKLPIVFGAMVIGPGVRDADPDGVTAVTPAWRNGIVALVAISTWNWNATDGEKAARNATLVFTESLRASFPDSGTYINEASIDEPEWAQSFWGDRNYKKLLAIKGRVDPSGLFVCRKCVGSEFWEHDGNCKTS